MAVQATFMTIAEINAKYGKGTKVKASPLGFMDFSGDQRHRSGPYWAIITPDGIMHMVSEADYKDMLARKKAAGITD